ncbi:PH domain-containing protein [Isoptericola aurantiacus]|uniref:PH domain-containing protein n=1 Tax=Isoptericola aurantiacus TaxID=3377839 RepID=UPI00383A9698
MEPPDEAVRTHRHLRRYLLTGETVTVATRLHWAKILEPIATALAVTVLVAWLHSTTGTGWVWLLWAVAAGRFLFRWAEWNYEWFVATDKRLILTYGFIIHKVAMMPLVKVTDMGYSRTPTGQVLGYGRFVMESAGQDQALRQVDYVPNPDHTYRTLCDTIFMPRTQPGQGQPRRSEGPPPSVVPSGRREPRPTTAELPIVPPPGRGAAHPAESRSPAPQDASRPAPGAPTWQATGGVTVPQPFDSSEVAGPSGRTRPRQGRPASSRRPARSRGSERSPYDPPSSDGPGTTVPDPFL